MSNHMCERRTSVVGNVQRKDSGDGCAYSHVLLVLAEAGQAQRSSVPLLDKLLLQLICTWIVRTLHRAHSEYARAGLHTDLEPGVPIQPRRTTRPRFRCSDAAATHCKASPTLQLIVNTFISRASYGKACKLWQNTHQRTWKRGARWWMRPSSGSRAPHCPSLPSALAPGISSSP